MTRVPQLLRLLLAVCLLLLAAAPAWAHASLVSSDPANGATITTPATLTATFDEPMASDRSGIVVENAAGEEVARGNVGPIDSRVMTVRLPALPPGRYQANWTAVTPDDEAVTRGMISFVVTPSASPTDGASPGGSPSPSPPRPGLPLITPIPGAPTPTPRTTSSPQPTATASPIPSRTASPSPTVTPTPPPAAPVGRNDLFLAVAVAAVILGGLGLYLLRR